MKRMTIKTWLTAGSVISMACAATVTQAQQVPATPSPDTTAEPTRPSNEQLEDIVVTANRRAEALQDVPAAITAISGAELQRNNITSLEGVADRTPGLTFAAFAAGQPEIAIRGVGTKEDGPAASDSTVVSIDEVYIAARSAQVFDLFDLERVEVLRGPQGTLYGKNSIGGSINFVTLQPNETRRVRASVRLGNFGRRDVGALISGPLSNVLFAKAAVSYRSTDGFLRNVLVGGPFFGDRQGKTESISYRGTLRFTPTEKLEIIASIDGVSDDNGLTNREPVGSRGPLHDCNCASDPIAVNIAFGGADSPYTTLTAIQGFTKRDVFGASLRVNYDLDIATLTSISGYRTTRYRYLEDSSGLPASRIFTDLTGASGNPNAGLLAPATTGFTFSVADAVTERPDQYTQELRLTSPTGKRFEYLIGLFASREENSRTESFTFFSLGRADGAPSASVSEQSNKGTAFAGYTQIGFAVTDALKLTGGARYSYERKEITSQATVTSGLPLLLQTYPLARARESWSNLSFRGVADYTVARDALIYASVATGFKSGGFTGTASTREIATTPFDPEEAINYEIGTKTELFGRRLRVNASAFFTDYKDLQVTRFFQPAGTTVGQFITENAGKAEIKGLELEISARPFGGFDIGGTYAYLDAKYTEFTGRPSQNGQGNFTGNRLRQSPEHSLSAYIGYTLDLKGAGSLSARGGYKYQSLSFYDPDNNPIAIIPAYDLFDARVSYSTPDARWEVSLYAKNIGKERYRTHVFSQRDSRIAFALFGEPRTYGLNLSFNY